LDTAKPADKKRLIIFIIICFVITWSLVSIFPLGGIEYGTGISIILLAGIMFVPTISSILTRLITKEGFVNMYLRPNFKGNIKKYLLVFFGPTLLIILSMALYFLIFPAQFDSSLTTLNYLTSLSGGAGHSAETLMLIIVLQVAIIGPIVNIIPTLGEELGWRGYLLPKLRLFFSDRAALVIAGIIWGIWHAPIIALGHNYGTSYIGYPFLGILMMIVFCASLGIIEGYAAIKLKSAIPAAMIHSAMNAGAGLPLYLTNKSYNPLIGPTVLGIVGMLLLLVVAVYLFIKSSGKKPV
jgi:membrane protease YdiL (CAAX protease family)